MLPELDEPLAQGQSFDWVAQKFLNIMSLMLVIRDKSPQYSLSRSRSEAIIREFMHSLEAWAGA
jgi:hypothetical protein